MNSTEVFLIAILSIALMAVHPVHSQSENESIASKLNALVEQDRAEIVNATEELVKIKSVREDPQPGAPFGEGPARALAKALQMAADLGLAT